MGATKVMACRENRICRLLKALVDDPKRAVNWAGLAYGAMSAVAMTVMALWGFGVGSTTAIAVLAVPFACLIGGFIVISGLVVAANLGFAHISVSRDGVSFAKTTTTETVAITSPEQEGE